MCQSCGGAGRAGRAGRTAGGAHLEGWMGAGPWLATWRAGEQAGGPQPAVMRWTAHLGGCMSHKGEDLAPLPALRSKNTE